MPMLFTIFFFSFKGRTLKEREQRKKSKRRESQGISDIDRKSASKERNEPAK